MEETLDNSISAWIPGWEGEYQITTKGNIYSWKTGKPKLMKASLNRSANTLVRLAGAKSSFQICRLVYNTFHQVELDRGTYITHLDGDILNNSLNNLSIKIPKRKPIDDSTRKKYRVISEDSKTDEMLTDKDISLKYGISIPDLKKAAKSGKWLEVYSKKNLK